MALSIEDLRQLCAAHWNPIGVPMSNVATEASLGYRPLPADEYDRYLSHMLILLAQGASDGELLGYLSTVERDYIGLSAPAGNKDRFVAAVRALA